MTAAEIVRRLNALLALPPKERPISVYYVEELAGLARGQVREIAKAGRMHERTRIRLERALTWVENDQVRIVKHHGGPNGSRPSDVTIEAPRPPQVTVHIIQFSKQGPRVRSLALNPRAFDTPQTKAKEHGNG